MMKKSPRYKTRAVLREILAKEEIRDNDYPYFVRYLMPAVYERRKILFVANEKEKPILNALTLVECTPFDAKGKLTPECRKKLIKVLQNASQKTGFRMCAVFGKRDSVYFNPDGKVRRSSKPPSGGVTSLRFPIE